MMKLGVFQVDLASPRQAVLGAVELVQDLLRL